MFKEKIINDITGSVKMKICLLDLFIYIFIFLYPIAPDYLRLGKLSSSELIFFGFVILFFLTKWKLKKLITINLLKNYWFYILLSIVPIFTHNEQAIVLDTVIKPLVICIILIQWCNSKEKVEKIIHILIIAGLLMCILGVVESKTQFNVFSLIQNYGLDEKMGAMWLDQRYGRVRIEGSFGQAIPFSIYLVFINVLTIYKLYSKNSISLRKRILYFIVWSLSILCIVLTGTRVSMLLVGLIQLYAIYTMRTQYKILMIVIGIACIGIYAFAGGEGNILTDSIYTLLSLIKPGLAKKISDSGSTTTYRLSMFAYLWQFLTKHLWIGMGYVNSLNVAVPVEGSNGTWYQYSIDNNYLVWWLRYGLVGMTANIFYNVYPIRFLFGTKRTCDYSSSINKRMHLLLWIFIGYSVILITVFQMGEKRIHSILIALVFVMYYLNKKNA